MRDLYYVDSSVQEIPYRPDHLLPVTHHPCVLSPFELAYVQYPSFELLPTSVRCSLHPFPAADKRVDSPTVLLLH